MTEDLGHEWGKLVVGEATIPGVWCRKCGCNDTHAMAETQCPNRSPSKHKMAASRWAPLEAPF